MKDTLIFILVIVLIVAIGIAIGMSPRPNNEQESNEMINEIENEVENLNNVDTEKENIENEQVNEQNTLTNDIVSSETFEDNPKTQEQKALDIVSKDWGNKKDNVKFSTEGMDENGKYIISVRDVNTTEALAFYTVNVTDGTFTKKEIF